MNIDNLTLGEIKSLKSLLNNGVVNNEPIAEVGKDYFIRTITHHYTGRCVSCNDDWLELEDAAWIADDGRFNNFLKTGIAEEVEPYVNNVRISVGCILDLTEFNHPLPKEVK